MSKKKRGAQHITTRLTITEYQRGWQAFTSGDYDAAIAAWTKALHTKPSETTAQALAEAYFRRACLNRKRAPGVMLDDLQAARRLAPDDARYSYHIGLMQHRQGNLPEAITAYRDSLQLEARQYDRPAYHLCLALAEAGQDPTSDPAWELLTPDQQSRLSPAHPALTKAVNLLHKGEWRSAESPLQQAASFDAGFAAYYRGVIAWRRGDADQACDHWQAAWRAGFDTPALRHNLTLVYTVRAIAQIDSPDFATTLKAASRLASQSPVLQALQQRSDFLAGNRAAEAGNWQKALDQWRKVRQTLIKQNGRIPRELLANIANACEQLGRWSEAAETWRELLRRRPRRGENVWSVQYAVQLWRHIDTLYARAGHFNKSAQTLRYAIKAQPDDLTLSLALVRRYMENQNWRSAKAAVLRVLETAPKQAEALALYAQITDADGDLDQMIEAWERAASVEDKRHTHLARQRLLKLYIERGEFYQSIEDYESAAVDLDKALQLAPRDTQLHAAYAAALIHIDAARARTALEQVDLAADEAALTVIRTWYQVGDRKEAARWLKRAITTGNPRPSLLVELGAAIAADHPEQASAYFKQALEQAAEREQPQLLTWVAASHAIQNRSVDAYDYARRALQCDAKFGPAHVHLGIWDAVRGRRPAALNHFQKALQWAAQQHRPDIANGIEEAISLLEEGYMPSLDDILDTIDPEGQDSAMRRMMGKLNR
ncbi:MAG: tetratricopeptide repeat protein [Anaerolineae bacterium]|nr:tetratricopeptide repeat protein [Anaerolineae bacterium]